MTIFAKCLDDDAVGIDERKMPVAEAARLVLENREVCEQRVQNFWKHYAKIVFGNCFGAVVEYNSYDEFGSTNSKVSFARTHHGPYLCGYKQDCRMRNDGQSSRATCVVEKVSRPVKHHCGLMTSMEMLAVILPFIDHLLLCTHRDFICSICTTMGVMLRRRTYMLG